MQKRESEKGQRLLEWKMNVPLLVVGLVFFVLACWGMVRYRFFHHPYTGKLARKEMVANLVFWMLPMVAALVKVNIPQRYNTLSRCILMVAGVLCSVITFNLTTWQIALPSIQRFYIINFAVSAALFMLLWMFVWDARIVAPLGCALWTLAGYAYRCVYLFRGTPFTPADVFSIGTGLAMAGHYSYEFISQDMVSIAVVLIIIGIAGWVPAEKPRGRKLRIGKVICMAMSAVAVLIMLKTPLLSVMEATNAVAMAEHDFMNRKQGSMSTFMFELRILLERKPAAYNDEKLKQLADQIEDSSIVTEAVVKPTVIVIMNESLSDPNKIWNLSTTGNPSPFLDSFKLESLHGELYVSVLGGGTAETEHGFLTGTMPMPSINIALMETVKESTPSLAWLFKSLGYSTVAIHPENGNNYQRNAKYPLLGFDEFFTITDFEGMEYYRNKVSDRASYQKIIEQYEQRAEHEPLFIFNVTIQNHGGYSSGLGKQEIHLTNPDDVMAYWKVEEYLNCIHESDRAISELIAYFRQQEDPVVILIFGDHQPNLNGITGLPHEGEQVEKALHDFRTPFYIWANYPIETGDYGKLSVNYLSALLLKTAGIPMEPYNAWCLKIAEEYPVVTMQGYAEADGRFHDWNDGEWPQALSDLNVLRYNRLYDAANRLSGLDVGVPD